MKVTLSFGAASAADHPRRIDKPHQERHLAATLHHHSLLSNIFHFSIFASFCITIACSSLVFRSLPEQHEDPPISDPARPGLRGLLHVRDGALRRSQVLAPDREAVPCRQEARLLPEGHLRAVYSCEFPARLPPLSIHVAHDIHSRCDAHPTPSRGPALADKGTCVA